MKMKISMLAILCTICAHGMEMEKNWSVVLHGTKINLTQGNMLAAYADETKKVDLIVVGYHEQEIVGNGSICGYPLGECRRVFHTKFKVDNSDQVTIFKPRKGYNRCFKITEPFVEFEYDQGKLNICCYERCVQLNTDKSYTLHEKLYRDEKAIEEASKDLALCYNNAFLYGLEQLKEKKEKSIAFPTLSADVGFPRDKAAHIAVASIFEYIQYNPKAYHCIELFMQEKDEFDLYKELFAKYHRIRENYILFCCIYNDVQKTEHLLATVPQDVITYIIKFF